MSTVGPALLEIPAICADEKCKMLVDTGSGITILPLKFQNRLVLRPTAVSLTAANGNPIVSLSQKVKA